jgi:hypothetical protein
VPDDAPTVRDLSVDDTRLMLERIVLGGSVPRVWVRRPRFVWNASRNGCTRGRVETGVEAGARAHRRSLRARRDRLPRHSALVENAMVADHRVIIPCRLEARAADGLGDLVDVLAILGRGSTSGALCGRGGTPAIRSERAVEMLKPWRSRLLQTVIPQSTRSIRRKSSASASSALTRGAPAPSGTSSTPTKSPNYGHQPQASDCRGGKRAHVRSIRSGSSRKGRCASGTGRANRSRPRGRTSGSARIGVNGRRNRPATRGSNLRRSVRLVRLIDVVCSAPGERRVVEDAFELLEKRLEFTVHLDARLRVAEEEAGGSPHGAGGEAGEQEREGVHGRLLLK